LGQADLALLIAFFSLGVALATFVWKVIYDVYFDAPRLKVSIRAMSIFGGGEAVPVFVLNATNKGRQPMVVTSIWLGVGRPVRSWWRLARRFMTKKRRAKVFKTGLVLPTLEGSTYNTVLPKRLDPSDQANFYYGKVEVRDRFIEDKLEYKFLYASVETTTGGKQSKPMRVDFANDAEEPSDQI